MEKVELDGNAKWYTHTKTDVKNLRSGGAVMFRGIKTSSGNQTAKLKSIHGVTTFVVDEAEEWVSEREFETIMLSIRQIKAQRAGVKDKATKAEINTETAIVRANCL